MKKIGTTALVVLTALSLSAFVAGCKKNESKPAPKPTNSTAPADNKPADGGH